MTSWQPLKIVLRHKTQPVDLLNNAKRVFDDAKNKEILAAKQETSPSIGEKLSRLLSISKQQNDEDKGNGGSNEALFPQVDQAGNATAGSAGKKVFKRSVTYQPALARDFSPTRIMF